MPRLYDAGVALCASSDSPVQSIDPFLQMLGMAEFSVPGQSLTNFEAMRCYTAHPARVLGEEARFGILEIRFARSRARGVFRGAGGLHLSPGEAKGALPCALSESLLNK